MPSGQGAFRHLLLSPTGTWREALLSEILTPCTTPIAPPSFGISCWSTLLAVVCAQPYGFSNSARGMAGPPKFHDAAVTLDSDSATSIVLK